MPNHSPSYPSVSLPVALERVKSLYETWGQIEISVGDALDFWGYDPRGGAGHRLLSAMVSFGLLDSSGERNERRIKISEAVLSSIFSGKLSQCKKSEAINEFALNPRIYQVLWERWGNSLPTEIDLKQFLVDDLGFNPRMVPQFLRGYRETLELAIDNGFGKPRDDVDRDDTDLDFAEDEVKFGFKPHDQNYSYSEEDTDLELKLVIQSQKSMREKIAFRASDDDTNVDVAKVDLPLDPIADTTQYYLDDEHIDFRLDGNDNEDVTYSNNIDKIGNLLVKRIEKSKNRETKEIARYPVASNCNIHLFADGHVDRHAIEALVAQLKLQLELGEFDTMDD